MPLALSVSLGGNVSTSLFKADRSGGGRLRGAEPHLMRVIKTLKQVKRREPEDPAIGAAGRKHAGLPSKLRIEKRAAKSVA